MYRFSPSFSLLFLSPLSLLSLPLLSLSSFFLRLSLLSLPLLFISPFSLSLFPSSRSLSLFLSFSFSYFVVFILADYSAIYSLSLYIYPLSSLSGFHRWLNIFLKNISFHTKTFLVSFLSSLTITSSFSITSSPTSLYYLSFWSLL